MIAIWRYIGLLLCTSFCVVPLCAATLEGRISDAQTGEPLVGVYVYLVESRVGAVSDADGRYALQIAKGTYTLQVT